MLLAEHDAEDEGEDPEAGTATEKWLFPTLFRVAQQAERTAPNMMLLGLRTLSRHVGPGQHAKRLPSG
jgi:hypothetical protein